MFSRIMLGLAASIVLLPLHANAITLVDQGEPRAVVVTADEPNPAAAYAAQELVHHIEMATGVTLAIAHESQVPPGGASRIYVGATQAALERGIVADEIPPDAFLLRTVGNDLYIVGREEHTVDFFESAARRGTLYGVYELLGRYLQVRWLWPGDLGTYVPQTDTVAIDDPLDEVVLPAFQFRRFRMYHIHRQVDDYDPEIARLAFTEAVLRDYADALETYAVRHRLGNTAPKPTVGHHFAGWWKRHGEEHPEWFMLREDGGRGPAPGADERSLHHVAMCVSNPDLHRYIVEEHWDGGDVLSLGEVDVREFCQCENCLAWDGPQPEDPPSFARPDYTPRMVSDRYARFWKTIQEMAAEKNPDVMVTTFLYWNYLPAPTGDIELNEHIYGEFVPWTGPYVYFPMPEEREQWVREQWLKWKNTGITMAYRPNYFHGGYVMPNISTWQVGEFFKFAYENGMVGFDYDSFYGHWATKGPMLYVHMRLFTDPELQVEQIREEYFSAFGPAAAHVERYFDYWEEHSGVRGGNPVDVAGSYPPEVFEPAKQMLAEAMEAAVNHSRSEYAERVAFLQAGLEHARLAAKFIRSTDRGKLPEVPPGAEGDDGLAGSAGRSELPENLARFRKTQRVLKELIDFRREHEHLFFADLIDAASRENRRIDIDRLLIGME